MEAGALLPLLLDQLSIVIALCEHLMRCLVFGLPLIVVVTLL